MKRALRVLGMVLAALVVLSFVGCKPTEDASIFNTWFLDYFFGTETITFTQTSFSRVGTGLGSGTQSGTVDAYNEDLGQIRVTATSATGFYSTGTIYFSYSIDGNQMEYSESIVDYPSNTDDNGPFQVQ